jgi:hypothetical protein
MSTIVSFPTVDEMHAFAGRLAAQHADRVTLREVGRSRQGDPIELLSIRADGARGRALIIGMPHPNEPIGMATIVSLCESLLADTDALDATGVDWHIVPCADPDGTRLNEGWFAGPWTREHYMRNFFRPGGEEQVEWTFPFSSDTFSIDAPMPETRALMVAIDDVKPTVLASLHNAEVGGAYYYVTPGPQAFYDRLTELLVENGIPPHLGEPDAPVSATLAPAIFSVPLTQQLVELATSMGLDPAVLVTGGSSLDHARQYGEPFGVVIELPYWRDPRADDTSVDPSGRSRRDVVLSGLEAQGVAMTTLRELYDAASPLPESPFSRAVGSFLTLFESGYLEGPTQHALADPSYEEPATVADAFSARDQLHAARLRIGGMLLRALPEGSPVGDRAEETFAQWCAEDAAESKLEVIPIDDLVAVQIGAILAAVEHAPAS